MISQFLAPNNLQSNMAFANLDASEIAYISCKMNDISLQVMNRNLKEISAYNSTANVFKNDQAEITLLKAMTEKVLPFKTCIKYLLFSQCLKINKNRTPPSIFKLCEKDHKINENALKTLSASFADKISEAEKTKLIEKLKQMPPSDSQFFCFKLKNTKENTAIIRAFNLKVKHRLGFLKKPCKKRVSTYLTIYPPVLFENILSSKFGEQAIKPNYVFGLSAPEKFDKADMRDIYIPTDLFKQPREFDGYKCCSMTFHYHDQYHAWLESTNPHRKLWLDINLGLQPFLIRLGYENKINKLRDREFNYCLKHEKPAVIHFILMLQKIIFGTPTKEAGNLKGYKLDVMRSDLDFFFEKIVKIINQYNTNTDLTKQIHYDDTDLNKWLPLDNSNEMLTDKSYFNSVVHKYFKDISIDLTNHQSC